MSILDEAGQPILQSVASGQSLKLDQPVRLQFEISTTDPAQTPLLDSYQLTFDADQPISLPP